MFFSLIVSNLNPFSLERKFDNLMARNCIKIKWDIYVPNELYRFICLENDYYTLNQLEITFNKANQVIKSFLEKNANSKELLENYFKQ